MSRGTLAGSVDTRCAHPAAAVGTGLPRPRTVLTVRACPDGTVFAARITGRVAVIKPRRCRPTEFVVGLLQGQLQPSLIARQGSRARPDHVILSRLGIS